MPYPCQLLLVGSQCLLCNLNHRSRSLPGGPTPGPTGTGTGRLRLGPQDQSVRMNSENVGQKATALQSQLESVKQPAHPTPSHPITPSPARPPGPNLKALLHRHPNRDPSPWPFPYDPSEANQVVSPACTDQELVNSRAAPLSKICAIKSSSAPAATNLYQKKSRYCRMGYFFLKRNSP